VVGLLDTGAAVNVIGGKLAEQLIRSKVPFKRVATIATTADGRKQEVVGRLQTPVKYKNVTKDLEFHIIPSLNKNLYLDITFWAVFNLLPSSMQVSEMVSDSHILTEGQQCSLSKVIETFSSFASLGLGKTTLISYEIKIIFRSHLRLKNLFITKSTECWKWG